MLNFTELALRRGPRLLFDKATFSIHAGWKVGLTGGNGTGKSSLFAMIRGELSPDLGDATVPKDWVISHVAQETPAVNRPAIEYVLDGDEELRGIEADLERAEEENDGHRVGELHGRLASIGGYEARARAARLMHGLGFPPDQDDRPVAEYSGGWRMRLNLARALMCRSDLLLLDEPTNHLDLDAVIWLEDWLRAYAGTLILISHDRDFLDSVVNQVLHIERGGVKLYSGNYSAFERQRAEHLAQQQSAYESQQREIKHMHRFVERFRAKATKAKQAQSRLKALERMEEIAPAHVDSPFHFSFKELPHLPSPLLQLEEVNAGYGETTIFSGAQITLLPGDRVGLLGHNGAGKSTLIKVLAGELAPMTGQRREAKDLRIGYFAQHQLEQLDPEASPLLHLKRIDPVTREQALRDYLGGFAFQGERVDEAVAPFSGGEKARLVLALLVYRKPQLLLLDEPTNHLDLEMRLALNIALQAFEGAVVLVSHDRHLLRTVAEDLLLVDAGRVEPFKGDVDAYRQWLESGRKPEAETEESSSTAAKTAPTSNASRKDQRRESADKRKASQPLRNRMQRLEKVMDRLDQESAEIDQAMADPALYEAENADKVQELSFRRAQLQKERDEAETEWFEVAETLEAM
ncbi:MAG: ATP-binding cassette domain-containing protein [Gammaproteobacteria bacterium]